jgi:hypothetical protein
MKIHDNFTLLHVLVFVRGFNVVTPYVEIIESP